MNPEAPVMPIIITLTLHASVFGEGLGSVKTVRDPSAYLRARFRAGVRVSSMQPNSWVARIH